MAAGAVILPKDCDILYINDSKKLSAAKREALYDEIMEKAVAVGVGLVGPQRIDEINILQATYEAMREAIRNLGVAPDILLNDAVTIPEVSIPQVPIIKGDAKSISIGAASIIAKVTRDRLMAEYDELMPEYGFASNKGYGSAEHIAAIKKYGASPIPYDIYKEFYLGGICMQISDLLGKYGQNTVPVTAQEQAVKTGTQQLTGTLSSLQTGNVFEGTVTDISDGQVLLTLANGEKISARLEGQIQLQLNQAMFFEVKSNTQTQIAIKPYLNGDSSNPTLLKALMQAGMGVTTDNLEMVRTMMEEQLPIDKNSLNQMMRQLAMFPKAEPSVIAQMNKLGIPVTEANVQQFSNYKADTAAIMKELENVLEQLPKSIAGEGDTAGQMTAKNMQLMDILFGGETIEQSQDTGAKAQELLAKTADGSVVIKNGTEQQAADIAKELQQTLSTAEDGTLQTGASDEGIQQADAVKQTVNGQMPAVAQGSLGEILGKEGVAGLEQQLKRVRNRRKTSLA